MACDDIELDIDRVGGDPSAIASVDNGDMSAELLVSSSEDVWLLRFIAFLNSGSYLFR